MAAPGLQRPPAFGPGALRYVEYFLGLLSGSGLDTGAKMEVLGMVNGFAISYGGVQAALAEERARDLVLGPLSRSRPPAAPAWTTAIRRPRPATKPPAGRLSGPTAPAAPGRGRRSSTAASCGSSTGHWAPAAEAARDPVRRAAEREVPGGAQAGNGGGKWRILITRETDLAGLGNGVAGC